MNWDNRNLESFNAWKSQVCSFSLKHCSKSHQIYIGGHCLESTASANLEGVKLGFFYNSQVRPPLGYCCHMLTTLNLVDSSREKGYSAYQWFSPLYQTPCLDHNHAVVPLFHRYFQLLCSSELALIIPPHHHLYPHLDKKRAQTIHIV